MKWHAVLLCLLFWASAVSAQFMWSRNPRLSSGAVDVGSPVAWWKMTGSDTNATQILDSVDGYHASNMFSVATGPTLATNGGVVYYEFANSATQHFLADDQQFYSSTTLTLSCWTYLPSYNAGTGTKNIMGKGTVSDSTMEWVVLFRDASFATYGNKIGFFHQSDDGSLSCAAYMAPAYSTNWCHLAITVIGNTGTNIAFFTNGVQTDIIASAGAGTRAADAGPFYIGWGQGVANRGWQGGIDDVRIFTNILSPTQIWNIYAAGRQ